MITNRTQQGFTLVETLVALALVASSLVPIFFLSSSSARLSQNIEHDVVATNLVQEGIEVIRAIRDSNWFSSAPFPAGLDDGDYEVEWDSGVPMASYVGRFLRIDDNGRYTYDPTAPKRTIFQRKVTIQRISDVELKVTSMVIWQERGAVRQIELEDHLFDWR